MHTRHDNHVYYVKSVRIWSFSGPYSVRMRVRARKTPNTDTFSCSDMSNFKEYLQWSPFLVKLPSAALLTKGFFRKCFHVSFAQAFRTAMLQTVSIV